MGGYTAVQLATSPDRSNPIVAALLVPAENRSATDGVVMPAGPGHRYEASMSDWNVSRALGVPIALASTFSFQQDLGRLLCAHHLAVARSSLNAMLYDSPNLRDVYAFSSVPCAPMVPSQPCPGSSAKSGAGGRSSLRRALSAVGGASHADRTRTWCVSARPPAPIYSVDVRWENNASQVHEMLTYGEGGLLSTPVQTGGLQADC